MAGAVTHSRYRKFNELSIEGSEILRMLPDKKVLFVSNHQTYFADVIAMYHVFNAALTGRNDSIKNVLYLYQPKLNIYYIAAKETMKKSLLTKLFAYAGSISVERTWRDSGQEVNRQVKMSDISNIGIAINDGWVITFPQGTTRAWAPLRKGTAHIIKKYKPIVVPVVIDGFRRSFDKKGLYIKKKEVLQTMKVKAPLILDSDTMDVDEIMNELAFAIEQHPSLIKVKPQD
ncbi:MAG: 1-acyl-sn-glycerol-3-phosphate acyltransferase [Flavobacteriaceae bacterium]|nr:1-acyl-sn-glycerol-3-phosphate acyltransferase [Flavobacteriaceae bacterium]